MAIPKQKHPGGRPLAFKSVQELQDKIEDYFTWCDNRTKKIYDNKKGIEYMVSDPAPYTMSGLARRLGVDRETILNYSKKEEYFGTIRDAREKVHEDVETRLMGTKNEKGAIFNLKNNFGWKDESKVDNTIHIPQPIYGGKSQV
jgi:hypothetical protein